MNIGEERISIVLFLPNSSFSSLSLDSNNAIPNLITNLQNSSID
jgi:hypothetical protein